MKKNKLLQEMVSQLATSASVPKLTRSHKEASLVIALKQKIKELETENVELKNANMTIKKNIRLTKHYENDVANKTLEEECKRLRLMLEELINEKHVGSPSEYAELEGKMLEQKAIIKELKIKNLELSQELSRARDSERQILERIKEYEVQEQKVHREKQKVKRQRQEINEARERIAALENEKEELKAKIEELQSAETRREHDTSQIDVIEKLNSNIEKLKLEKEELKRRADASERKILEINREMREERNKAKEKEEEYTLKMLEERERLNQRIVRLDRELSAKSKELAENDKKVKEVETVKSLGAVREITKPAVQDKDLVHTKQWIKLVLLRYKKGLNELKEELFAEYKGEERISIKELTKIFQRPALSLPLMQAEDLSRYLIEPKDQPMVVYNKYSDKVMVEIRIKLDSFLSIDYPKDFYEKIQEATESAIDKIKDRFRYMKSSVEDVALENGKVELVQWLRICKDMFPGLTSLEKDCLIALMVTEQEDVKQLKFSNLVKAVEDNEKVVKKSIAPIEEKRTSPKKVEEVVQNIPKEPDHEEVSKKPVETPKIVEEIIKNEPMIKDVTKPKENIFTEEPRPGPSESIKPQQEPPKRIEIEEASDAPEDFPVETEAPNKEPPRENETPPAATPEPASKLTQDEYITLIKDCLKEKDTTLAKLIEEKVMIGKGEEEGEEYEIVMIPDLVYLLTPVCSSKLGSRNIIGLGDFFRTLVENNENYVLVQDLLEIFGEKLPELENNKEAAEEEDEEEDDEGLLEGIDNLNDESFTIIAHIIQRLQENKVNFFDLFKDTMYQQQISVGDQEVVVDVIDSKDFYAILKKIGVVDKELKNLSDFLCLDKEYPNIFLIKKVVRLIEHVAVGLEQQEDENYEVAEEEEPIQSDNEEQDERDIE